MSESQFKKEVADLKSQLELARSQIEALNLKNLDLEDKNDDLQQVSKKILRDKNEELEKMKAKLMEINLQNANLEKENFELKQQIELDESRTYGSHYSERSKMSEIPQKLLNPVQLQTKPKAKSVQFQEHESNQITDCSSSSPPPPPKKGQQKESGINDDIQVVDKYSVTLINQELQRRNSELMMIVEKNNEVYTTSHQILVDLNLQTSNLVNEKTMLQQQVADLEDVIEEQQTQLILLFAENRELLQRLEFFSSGQKGNGMNTTEGTVVDFITNLQQFDNTDQIDWSHSLQHKSERKEIEKESGNSQQEQNGISAQQENENMMQQNGFENNRSGQNGCRNTQDETMLLSCENHQNNEQSSLSTTQKYNQQGYNSELISALGQQITELTQKLSIVSQKLSNSENDLQQAQRDNADSIQSLKQEIKDKDNQIEILMTNINKLQDQINHLEDDFEVQKAEFDNTIDELYSQYESKLQQFDQKLPLHIEITQN